jgi:Protein of unknown function (DUF2971)
MESSWPLFHYTSSATALDLILVDGRLRLGPPVGLNDPFESEPHWANLIQDDPEDSSPPEMSIFEAISDLLRDRCRLACLVESGPNEWTSVRGYGDGWMRARMWAQYADNHSGVCLAFDRQRLLSAANEMVSSKRLGLYADPIRYQTSGQPPADPIEIPLSRARSDLDLTVNELFPSVVHRLYFEKAWDWSTESEYRLLVHGSTDDAEYVDIRRALTGVFVGPRFPEGRLNDLTSRCAPLAAEQRMFTVRWRNGFPVVMQIMGRSMRRVSHWDVPPRPVDRVPAA